MTNDLIMLIVGVILGFGSSIGTLKYQEYGQRNRALKLLEIEMMKLDKSITPFAAEITQFNTISLTEIPNFKMVIQIEIFLNLPDTLRKTIYDILSDLEFAEKHRLLAIPLLNQEDKSRELDLYGTLYRDYLRTAKVKIEKLKVKLK